MYSKSTVTITTLLIFSFIAFFVSNAVAAADKPQNKPAVGYIDLESVVKAHPMLIKWNKEFDTLKASREKELEKKIKDKFGVTSESQLTEKQRTEVQKLILDENQKFASEMGKKNTEKLKQAEKDIKAAAAGVAADKKLDLVLDRAVVIFGGTDITDDVLKKIAK